MYKFISYKNQLIVLAILLIAIALQQFTSFSKPQESFKARPFDFETNKLTKISISNAQKVLLLEKGLTEWVVKTPEGVTANADQKALDALLSEFEKLTFKYVANQGNDKFAQYELTDSLATHVQAFVENKKVADLYIGKFDYNQANRTLTTHVRLNNSEQIYAVDGFLRMTINNDPATYRNKQLVQADANQITRIEINHLSESFALNKTKDGWLVDQTVADSTRIHEYLKKIATLNSRYFMNKMPENTQPESSIKVYENNKLSAQIEIQKNDNEAYAVISSINRGTIFNGKEMELDKIAPPRSFFLNSEEKK